MDAKSYILSDLPTEKDGFDFAPYVNTLVEVITSPNTSTPLTLGIFGTWGSGKTSLMRMIEKGLPKSFRTTWFNAWMYNKEDTLWRVLLLHVLTALKEYYMNEFLKADARMALAGKTRGHLPTALAEFTDRDAVRRILTLHQPNAPDVNISDLRPNDIRLYFTLTRRTESVPAVGVNLPRLFFEPQMIHIPAGAFIMGSNEDQIQQVVETGVEPERLKREFPQHLVELSDYYIGKYPVTNREYQAFIMETGFQPPAGWDEFRYPKDKGDHPVVNVSWEASTEYCKWLSEKTGKEYRLPTEAEWEKAARGTNGRVFPWGNKFDRNRCNTGEAKLSDTMPVGQYSPRGDSPYGCADMSGNIWEWCADWFNETEYEDRIGIVVRDPRGPETGEYRVLRGGSFILGQSEARCASRFRLKPFYWFDFGFRVAMSMPPAETD
jgi:formylglycine-generating enzyme required for sulfatase activity